MRRQDVAIAIGIGLTGVGYIVLIGSGTSHPIGNFIEKTALALWPIGVALLATAIVVHRRHRWPVVERLLGYVGVAWVSFMLGYGLVLVLLLLLVVLNGGFGY